MTNIKTLKAMGIEVWKLRKDEASLLNDSSERALPVIAEKRMGGDDQHVAISDDFPATPRFRIAMLHYGSIGICLSLEQGAEFPRRFCDDLARFMAADLQSLKFKIVEWPMLDTSGIDQSVEAARQVVKQRFSALPEKVIVIGEEIVQYCEPLEEIQDGTPFLVGGQSYLLLPSLTDLFRSASKKRLLMGLLENWH